MEEKIENEISYLIRGAIFKVYNELGPGLLESVYETVLMYELQKHGLLVKKQVSLPGFYDGIELEIGFRLDLIIESTSQTSTNIFKDFKNEVRNFSKF